MSMYEQCWVKTQNHNFFHPSSAEYPSYGCCNVSHKAVYMIKNTRNNRWKTCLCMGRMGS